MGGATRRRGVFHDGLHKAEAHAGAAAPPASPHDNALGRETAYALAAAAEAAPCCFSSSVQRGQRHVKK